MLDRVLAAILALMVCALLMQFLSTLALIVLHELGRFFGSCGVALVSLVLVVGVSAKLLRGRSEHSDHAERREERLVRERVRRPATDVPLEAQAEGADDDPAVTDADEADAP